MKVETTIRFELKEVTKDLVSIKSKTLPQGKEYQFFRVYYPDWIPAEEALFLTSSAYANTYPGREFYYQYITSGFICYVTYATEKCNTH